MIPPRRIPDSGTLWRRLHKRWLLPNGELSSEAFRDGYTRRVSVHWMELSSLDRVRVAAMESDQAMAAAEVLASVPRALDHCVQHVPTCKDESHSELIPPAGAGSNEIRRLSKQMTRAARIVRF